MPQPPGIRILKVMNRLKTTVQRSILQLFVLMIVLMPKLAWAQAAPTPHLRNYPKAWIGMILMMLLGVVVLGISLFPSKRGHQD